jgi:thioredoxin-dependent peroxiredoxin
MAMPQVGETAPDFEIQTDSGESTRLSDYRGQRVVLYFYPKSDTPGCTKQACSIRDSYGAFEQKGVVVLGASPDTVEEQAAFKSKYNLPFTLLADADHSLAELYGLWGTHKIMYQGIEHTTHGVRRSTLIIDENGIVTYSQFGVDPANNTAEILDVL